MTEIFDPATATWSTTRDILFARYKHTAELLPDGRVMIAGGIEGDDDGAELGLGRGLRSRYRNIDRRRADAGRHGYRTVNGERNARHRPGRPGRVPNENGPGQMPGAVSLQRAISS